MVSKGTKISVQIIIIKVICEKERCFGLQLRGSGGEKRERPLCMNDSRGTSEGVWF